MEIFGIIPMIDVSSLQRDEAQHGDVQFSDEACDSIPCNCNCDCYDCVAKD